MKLVETGFRFLAIKKDTTPDGKAGGVIFLTSQVFSLVSAETSSLLHAPFISVTLFFARALSWMGCKPPPASCAYNAGRRQKNNTAGRR